MPNYIIHDELTQFRGLNQSTVLDEFTARDLDVHIAHRATILGTFALLAAAGSNQYKIIFDRVYQSARSPRDNIECNSSSDHRKI